jgi:hypothetical protein
MEVLCTVHYTLYPAHCTDGIVASIKVATAQGYLLSEERWCTRSDDSARPEGGRKRPRR